MTMSELLLTPLNHKIYTEVSKKDIKKEDFQKSSRGNLHFPSHTTVRAVRHTAVQPNFKA